MAFYEATWDTQNDWSAWATNGMGTDITASKATPPLPFIGQAGRLQTTWTVGAGAVTYRLVPPTLVDTRTMRCAFALFVKDLTLASSTIGPIRFIAKDNGGSSLGEAFTLSCIKSGSSLSLQFFNALNTTLSANSFALDKFLNEWIVLDFAITCTTTTAGTFQVDAYCDVWVYRAGKLRFATRLALDPYVGSAYQISDIRIGFAALQKNVDSHDFYIDEFRADTAGGVALPRAPSLSSDIYPAHVRVRRWDRATSTWKSSWDLDRSAIESMQCDYFAYRVEDRCQITLADVGRTNPSKAQDLLDDMERNPKALYRLDVYAADVTYLNPQYPSTWRDDTVFWSGVLVRREPDQSQENRGIQLSAVGWTAYLAKLPIQKKGYYKQTINAILTDLLAAVSSYWPGTLSLVTRTGGLDASLVVPSVIFDGTTLDACLLALSRLGQFFYGVSVCGYPSFESSNAEFRLVFLEPNSELDIASTSTRLGEEIGFAIDPSNDLRVTRYSRIIDDSKYANRWDVLGADVHVDFRSIITGQDRDEVRDYTSLSSTLAGHKSGAFEWENGLVGFDLVLIDYARRSINVTDARDGTVYPAGFLDQLPIQYQKLGGESAFPIYAYAETSGTSIYTLGNFPADSENLALTVTVRALRYLLRPSGIRVTRTVIDAEDNASSGREAIATIIEQPTARGWQLAGVTAMTARWAERRNAEQVTLEVANWKRVPNGSRSQYDNLVALLDGSARLTILGTTAQGGDNWKYGDDERPVGNARLFEIRACSMELNESGWTARYTLGAAPRDLESLFAPAIGADFFAGNSKDRGDRAFAI